MKRERRIPRGKRLARSSVGIQMEVRRMVGSLSVELGMKGVQLRRKVLTVVVELHGGVHIVLSKPARLHAVNLTRGVPYRVDAGCAVHPMQVGYAGVLRAIVRDVEVQECVACKVGQVFFLRHYFCRWRRAD
jgi:hypothetical protein